MKKIGLVILLVIMVITFIGCISATTVKVEKIEGDKLQISGRLDHSYNSDYYFWFVDYEIMKIVNENIKVIISSKQDDTMYITRGFREFSFIKDMPELDTGMYFIIVTISKVMSPEIGHIKILQEIKSGPISLIID